MSALYEKEYIEILKPGVQCSELCLGMSQPSAAAMRQVVLGYKQSGGYQLTAVLNFGVFNGPKKNFKLHTVYSGVSEQIKVIIKPLQRIGQAAEFKFESKFEPLLAIWQSSEGYSRR